MKKKQALRESVKKSVVKGKARVSDCFSDITGVLTHSISDATFLFSSLLAVSIVYTHHEFANGVIGKALTTSKNPIAVWILANTAKFLGLTLFVPTVTQLSPSVRTWAAVVIVVWTYLMPAESVFAYALLSGCLLVYFKAKFLPTRLFLLVTILILVSLEFFKIRF